MVIMSSGMHYPDANTVPWPINHHAYVQACADRLRKDLSDPPRVHLPACHLQHRDVRGARLRVGQDTTLYWNELRGWSHRCEGARVPLVPGAEALLDPDLMAAAVCALLAPDPRLLLVLEDRSRGAAHPVDAHFERRLAAYRRL
ncbi:hypothetical protein ACJOT3_04140 [Nocardiopsis sp. frass1]